MTRHLESNKERRSELLDRAIGEMSPDETRDRVLWAAAMWTVERNAAAAESRRPRQSRRRWVVAAVAVGAMLMCGVFTWQFAIRPGLVSHGPESYSPSNSMAESKAAVRQSAFYAQLPITRPVVAKDAPVLVTIGPEAPISRGVRVPHKALAVWPEDGNQRFHVWNWLELPISRIVKAKTSYRTAVTCVSAAAVSPDGQSILLPNGQMVDLSTGDVRQHYGFTRSENEHIDRLIFAPDGRHVAAMVRAAGNAAAPPAWSIRLISLDQAKVIARFPAARVDHFAWAAFSPDSNTLFHATPEKRTAGSRPALPRMLGRPIVPVTTQCPHHVRFPPGSSRIPSLAGQCQVQRKSQHMELSITLSNTTDSA